MDLMAERMTSAWIQGCVWKKVTELNYKINAADQKQVMDFC